ncbi:MAG: hypothetical protein FXF47_00480 [Candidatus Mcinerneyibacterium aminivorans]|uniref:Uncharacterized protein n=1 Tax=Candidatus Mcinerneyibacterium aminivorans TaxID=2703815 RepID=A0A5D0MKG7_9BACT|nr:MAG: hypothetical protein FXF47_00480 [Candidatus Mcinerneyibacterium aminivorans]
MKKLVILLILISVIFFAGCELTTGPDNPTLVEDLNLYPLTVGNTWTYDVYQYDYEQNKLVKDTSETIQITGIENFTYNEETLEGYSSSEGDSTYFIENETGIYKYYIQNSELVETLMIKYPYHKGESWDAGSGEGSIKWERIDSISIEEYTYSNCYVASTEVEMLGLSIKAEFYYKDNIGLVAMVAEETSSGMIMGQRILTNYSIVQN